MTSDALFETSIPELNLAHRGKVRDVYTVDDAHLLIVATDRLSAFDVVLPDPVPYKGEVLTQISNYWFGRTVGTVANHLSGLSVTKVVSDRSLHPILENRSVVARRLNALPVEAVVRGYLIGSGWKDYRKNGAVCGIELPVGLRLADRLPEPIFTPATKAAAGDHDENIPFSEVEKLIGPEQASRMRDISLRLYNDAAAYAQERGIIVADTKFEFGTDEFGELVLIDEILTPDSSRLWPVESYTTGVSPPSFDKQYVRDYLETLDWDKKAPGPELPEEVIQRTTDKYLEALDRLTDGTISVRSMSG